MASCCRPGTRSISSANNTVHANLICFSLICSLFSLGNIVSEMECRVCSAETTGFFYKISACRACAAYFRRSVQRKCLYPCRRNKNCPTDHRQKFCRYCRMKKCLVSGMVTDGSESLLDYYLKGIKPDITTTSGLSEDPEFTSEEDDGPNFATCFSDNTKFETSLKEKISNVLKKGYRFPEQPYNLNLCQQSARAYDIHSSKYKKDPKMNLSGKGAFTAEDTEKLFSGIFVVLIRVAEYFMDIEPFAKLPFLEKVALYRQKGKSFCDIALAAHTVQIVGRNLDDTRWAHFDGQVFDMINSKFDMSTVCNHDEMRIKDMMNDSYADIDKILHRPFKIVNPDNFEVQYMLMKCLWNFDDVEGLSTETMLSGSKIQAQLDEELGYYYNFEKGLENVASRIYKIHNLITAVEKVVDLREADKQMWKTFEIFKFDFWIDDLPD